MIAFDMLSNVRSLNNKLTDLSEQTSLFCFTQSWLLEDIHIDGFNIIWLDRDTARTRKTIRAVSAWLSTTSRQPTTQLLLWGLDCVLQTPLFAPDFTQIVVILAYVPEPDYNLAADLIPDFWAVTRTGEQPVFLLGDFDRCDVTTVLPNLEQYVTSPTRLDRMLDLCYGNIPGAYISKACPPLPWYRQ